MYANEETIQAIIDETLLRIPDKDEHKQFWKNTCIDITNFENKSIENLEPGAYIHYGALDSVHDLFPNSFNAKRNPETVAILTSCEMFVLEIDRRYKQLRYQLSGGGYVEFTDFSCKIFVYNATDIDGDTGNFSRQFDFLWRSSWNDGHGGGAGKKSTLPWYTQSETFQEYVDNEYVSTTFGYDSIVHKKGSDEYVYSFPEATGTIALSENIPTKLSDLSNDSEYITINSVGNGILTITQNGTSKGTFTANQSSNSTVDIAVPTKLSDLTNDSGYITINSIGNGILTITQNGTNKGTFSANQSSNSTVDIAVPTKVSELTNDSGYTTNIGTVTQVKVGSTAYNPSSGVVSLPAYPTTLPASDVYAWAKASTKPSYSYSEINGTPTIPTSANYLERGGWWGPESGQNIDDITSGIHFVYSSHGAPVLAGTLVTFSGKGLDASPYYCWQMILDYGTGSNLYIRNRNGDSPGTWGIWRRIARADEIPTKLSQLTNDSGYITSSGSCANADTLQNSSPDESAGASTIVKRTSTGRVKAVYYNMSGDADNINSFTSNVAFVSSEGWIRKTSKANFSTWLLTWTKLGSTTGNTVLTYTGTYTEFFVVLDLGFYAETFYFVASALGENRYFFGGTTNTSDGSSWVLRAGRSNSTYSFKADRVHQDGTDYTSQVNVSVYAR